MSNDHPDLSPLDEFVDKALPAMLRRMRCWKGLSTERHADVLHDLRQELLLDWLENRPEIGALTPRQRHARWFRLLEHRHYQLRLRDARRIEAGAALDELPAAETAHPQRLLSAQDWQLALWLQRAVARLRNGRINTEGTAAQLGLHPREVRALWARIAAALGFDDDFLAFWRGRLVEALVGLAADILRDQRLVRVHDEAARRRPDPRGRLRRIRQIKRRVSVRPLPCDLKRVLARFTRNGLARELDPWQALQAARELEPRCATVLLWHFETAVAHDRLVEAARALRAARTSDADPVRLVLARARLLEARGSDARALAVLARAQSRHRGDQRLTVALNAITGVNTRAG